MIQNDKELQGTQERIVYFCQLVAHMRRIESPTNFKYMASGYLAEVEKMHAEVMEYLRRHPSESAAAQAA